MKPKERILEYLTNYGPASIRKIACELNMAWATVGRNVADLKTEGKVVEKEKYGNSRVVDVVRDA